MQKSFIEVYKVPVEINEHPFIGTRRTIVIKGVIPETVQVYGTDEDGNVLKSYTWAKENCMGMFYNDENFAFGQPDYVDDELILPDDIEAEKFFIFGKKEVKEKDTMDLSEVEEILSTENNADFIPPKDSDDFINFILSMYLLGKALDND